MTEVIKPDESKKLSLQSKQLLDELGTITTKAADLVPRLYKSLENDGIEHSEIFRLIQEKIDISRRRLYDLIPPESKRPYKKVQKLHNSKSNSSVTFQQPNRRLVVPEEPSIPPLPEIRKEAEIVREPPKPIEEPIKIQSKIIEFIFAPKTIDMVDTSQAFLIQLDITTGTVKNYKTVGRRTRLS